VATVFLHGPAWLRAGIVLNGKSRLEAGGTTNGLNQSYHTNSEGRCSHRFARSSQREPASGEGLRSPEKRDDLSYKTPAVAILPAGKGLRSPKKRDDPPLRLAGRPELHDASECGSVLDIARKYFEKSR
jgi:hypothetical protein